MMLNSRFELSKIEKNTRVEREICLATLENREWKENLFLPLSKIESRKRIVSCHSRKSRVEREMGTIKFSRSREKFLFLLSIFLSRARLLSMPDPLLWQKKEGHPMFFSSSAIFTLLYFADHPSSSTLGLIQNFPGNKIRFGRRRRLLVSCRYLQHFLSKCPLLTIRRCSVGAVNCAAQCRGTAG